MYQLYQLASLQLIFAITTRQNGDPAPAIASPMSACQFRTTTAATLSSRPFPKTLSQKSDIKGQILVIGRALRPEGPTLGSAEVVAAVGQREATGMSKHVRMHGRQARHERRLVVLERIAQKVLATLMGIGGGVAFDVYPASRLLGNRLESLGKIHSIYTGGLSS